jgi:hypothetical protein
MIDARWNEYRSSFLKFVNESARLQTLATEAPGDRNALEPVLVRLEFARLMHNESRDALASALCAGKPPSARPTETLPGIALDRHVASVARLVRRYGRDRTADSVTDRLIATRIVGVVKEQIRKAQLG